MRRKILAGVTGGFAGTFVHENFRNTNSGMTYLSLEILLLHALILVTILPKSGLSRFSDSEEWREMENTIPTTLHPEQAGQKAAVLPKTLFTRRVLH